MLFFKEKKKTKEEEESLVPRAPRYDSLALVRVNGFEGEALLKNISVTGFCMQSKTYANLTPGNKYIIRLFPEDSAGLEAIESEVEVRWVRSEVSKFEVGLLVTKYNGAGAKNMEKYIDHLKSQV
jgi:hypothetical protein